MSTKGKRQRSPFQILEDRQMIAHLYLTGKKQWEIGLEMNLTQARISQELKIVRKAWLDSSIRDFDKAKAEELAKIDRLEVEYWDAWKRSCETREKHITTTRTNERGDESGARVERENLYGDPRFLQGVERCIEQRCKIFGLYAATNIRVDLTELEQTLADEWLRVLKRPTEPDLASELTQ
jgi:hypothetical protein